MIVETFEVEESKDEMALLAADSEACELIEKLNLVGQLGLTDTETVTRFPYRKLTKEEGLVYGLLCPKRTAIEAYRDGIIPLRVLQVAAHANETGYLDSLIVWHPENADIKDPLLIGTKKVVTGPASYQYDTEQYLLARWGTELPSFDELKKLAKKMWINSTKLKLATVQREVLAAIQSVDSMADLDVMPNLTDKPYFSFNAY